MLTKQTIIKCTVLFMAITALGGSVSAGGAGGVQYSVGVQLPSSWGAQSPYVQKYTISVIDGYGYWLNDSDILGLFGSAISFDEQGSMSGGFGGIMLGRDFRIGRFNIGLVGKLGVGAIVKSDGEKSDYTNWITNEECNPENDISYQEYYSNFSDVFSVLASAQLSVGYTFTKWLRVEALGGVTAISNFENGGPFKNEKIWFPYLGVQASFGSFK